MSESRNYFDLSDYIANWIHFSQRSPYIKGTVHMSCMLRLWKGKGTMHFHPFRKLQISAGSFHKATKAMNMGQRGNHLSCLCEVSGPEHLNCQRACILHLVYPNISIQNLKTGIGSVVEQTPLSKKKIMRIFKTVREVLRLAIIANNR